MALDTGEVLSSHHIEPTRATGATNEETPADGRGPRFRAKRLSPMSRLMCHTCRDSRQWRARREANARDQRS